MTPFTTSLPFLSSQTNHPGQFAALWSTELQKEHLFFLFGCNSSADSIRLDFARPLVIDLGGSLGTPAIGADPLGPGVVPPPLGGGIGPTEGVVRPSGGGI